MSLRRSLLVATATAAALASPAAAGVEPRQNLVYTARASANVGATTVEAVCVFLADRWTADYGATTIQGTAVTSGAVRTTVRCEMESNGWIFGDASSTADGPAVYTSGYGNYIGENTVNRFCVTAVAEFTYVDTVSTGRLCGNG